MTTTGKHQTIPKFQKWQSLLYCALSRHKDCDYLGILVNKRNHDNMNIGGAGKYERLWWVEKQEQDWEAKEEGEFETFLRSLLLSLVGVYASGNELQRGRAADWLESDGCLCWPERLLLQPLLLSLSEHRLHLPANTVPAIGSCLLRELLGLFKCSFTNLFLNTPVLMKPWINPISFCVYHNYMKTIQWEILQQTFGHDSRKSTGVIDILNLGCITVKWSLPGPWYCACWLIGMAY